MVKICIECEDELTDENWSQSRRIRGDYICRKCHNERTCLWNKDNPDKANEKGKEIIDKFHAYSSEISEKNKSMSVNCRYPECIRMLCKHIGAREDMRYSVVYPSLVKLGRYVEYNAFENLDSPVHATYDYVHKMMASDNLGDMILADMLNRRSYEIRSFVYSRDFALEITEYAEECDVGVSDMFFYYALVGLKKIFDDSGAYNHISDEDRFYISCMHELENIDLRRTTNPKGSLIMNMQLRINQSAAWQGIMVEDWKEFISVKPYCEKFNYTFKEKIRNKFDRECFICGKDEENNGMKLDVHHVNYDKDCLCNDKKCEFVPLCRSCHAKTNGDREMWRRMIMNALCLEGWI